MKKIAFLLSVLSVLGFSSQLSAQALEEFKTDGKLVLTVNYFENYPFAFTSEKKEEAKGIEVDIMRAFAKWAIEKKGIEVELDFKSYPEFSTLYELTASAKDPLTVGLGSVTITEERKSEVQFSVPYLKNVSVLVSGGNIPTARSKEELENTFAELHPVVIKKSSHYEHLMNLIKKLNADSEISFAGSAEEIGQKIKESSKYYGYMDIISFWNYIRNSDQYLKIHRIANIEEERFGFIFPQGSSLNLLVNEFLESGFGFTATKEYHKILEDYLGHEVMEAVELDY